MQATFECVPCFVRQSVAAARIVTDDVALQERIIRETLHRLSQVDFGVTPLELGHVVHRAVRELSGIEDPYLEIKRQSTAHALARYPEMKQIVAAAGEPLRVAT